MAFPTTSLLDDFNRADAGNLGANWGADQMGVSVAGHDIVSNAATNGDHSYWSAATFGPDVEAWITASTIGVGQSIGLHLRIQSAGGIGTADGYEIVWNQNGTLSVDRVINSYGAGTGNLASTSTTGAANGSKLGARVTGTGATVTIDVYLDTGSGWGASPALTATDTDALRITSAGNIGFVCDPTAVADNFGGGTVVTRRFILARPA